MMMMMPIFTECLLCTRPYSKFLKCSNLLSTNYSPTRYVTIVTSILTMKKLSDTFSPLTEPSQC